MTDKTNFPASVEVVHRIIRGSTTAVTVITDDEAELTVYMKHDDLYLRGEAKDHTRQPKHEGKFFVALSRKNAEALARELAERLGLSEPAKKEV